MAFQQQRIAETDAYVGVPPDVAHAATRYQHHRAVEAQHLAVMASHNLLEHWTSEVHAAVLEARVHVRAAWEARTAFRRQVSEFVRSLRAEHTPLPAVLRHTRTMLHLLESSGAIQDDGGWLEAEVLEWAIEDYQVSD